MTYELGKKMYFFSDPSVRETFQDSWFVISPLTMLISVHNYIFLCLGFVVSAGLHFTYKLCDCAHTAFAHCLCAFTVLFTI